MAAAPWDVVPAVASAPGGRAETPSPPAAFRLRAAQSPPAAEPRAPHAFEQAGRAALEAAASRIREILQASSSALQFSFESDSGRTVLRIVDSESGELIRQIPSDEVLAIARALDRAIGVIFDRQA